MLVLSIDTQTKRLGKKLVVMNQAIPTTSAIDWMKGELNPLVS
jgi:hypothetical protein